MSLTNRIGIYIMKIQLKSDLHTEFDTGRNGGDESKHYIHPDADVVILAGDIVTQDTLDDIVEYYSHRHQPILYVPGNHEYYNSSLSVIDVGLANYFSDNNIYVLNPGYMIIKDVLFVGATLWTDLSNPMNAMYARKGMNDFYVIEDMTTGTWTDRHIRDKQFITNALNFKYCNDMKKVVITHFLPTYLSVSERYKDNGLNCAFVGNCDDVFNQDYSPDLWVHGHTHSSCDYAIGKTRVVCNPYGYNGNGTNKDYKNDLLIEI